MPNQRLATFPVVPVVCLAALLLCACPNALQAQASQVSEHHWQNVEKVVAFGDVHGAFDQLSNALVAAKIVDTQLRWVAGTTHLVSLGDLLDRGADSRKVMDLLMALQPQAATAGGRVHVVLGNHEVMNLTGDLRYVAAEEFAAFADPAAAAPESELPQPPGYANHRSAFAKDGPYGRWLLQLPLMVQINDSLFVHGGLPPVVAESPIADINARFREELDTLLTLGAGLAAAGLIDLDEDLLGQGRALAAWLANPENESADAQLREDAQQFVKVAESDLFSWQSPNWYRGTAKCAEPIEDTLATAALAKQSAKRVVMGHTPTSTRRVQQRLSGRAVLADTGMLTPYYGGQASLVTITANGLVVQYPASSMRLHAPERIPVMGQSSASLEARLTQAALPKEPGQRLDAGTVAAVFQPGSARENEAEVAAYRLSELLGWGIVPTTVDRGKGVLMARPKQTITESERVAANEGRPNHCAQGSAYQLMYAFDALTANNDRSAFPA